MTSRDLVLIADRVRERVQGAGRWFSLTKEQRTQAVGQCWSDQLKNADYIGSWLEGLREDNRAIVRAASQAGKVADYLLGSLLEAVVDMTAETAAGSGVRLSSATAGKRVRGRVVFRDGL